MLNVGKIARNTRIMMMIAGLALSGVASGADIEWAPVKAKGGMTVVVPSIDTDALVDEMVALKVALKHDEKLLSRAEEQKRTTGSDTVLSILMPGGLLYAAYKKNAHARVVREKKRVSAQLKEITTDLVAFMAIDGPILVAKR